MNNKLLLGELVIGLRAWCLVVQFDNGDFSLIIPYGVRVKGFLLWSLRVKGCPS